MSESLLGVQPIVDRGRQIVGYELLFRSTSGGLLDTDVDGDAASARVIINAFADIGVERLGRDKKLFINCSDWFLASGVMDTLPTDRVVLEVLEDAEMTPEFIDVVRNLADRGFEIALDDFVYAPAWDALLEVAHIVKLDVLGQDESAIRQSLAQLPGLDAARLLAEKVEDPAQFASCLDLGFELFQGYFLARPRVLSGTRPPENRLHILQLLARLHDEEISLREVETLISRDPGFSYRLLRFLTSAAVSQCRPVSTLGQAIALVGLRAIRQWASLVLLGGLGPEHPYSTTRALTTARYCQLVGEQAFPALKDELFTVGLFSNLDEILQVPLAEAVTHLPLDVAAKDAILHHQGVLGQVLASAVRIESCESTDGLALDGVDEATLGVCFLEAVAWSQEIETALPH